MGGTANVEEYMEKKGYEIDKAVRGAASMDESSVCIDNYRAREIDPLDMKSFVKWCEEQSKS
jgi:hypothetical protein